MVQRVEVQRGAVATRGSGHPDYSRVAVGQTREPVGQASGGALGVVVSGGTIGADIISGDVIARLRSIAEIVGDREGPTIRMFGDSNLNAMQLQTFPYLYAAGNEYDRMRNLGAFTGSRSGQPLAVGVVSGFQYVGLQDPHASGGAGTRYVAGVFSGASASGAGQFTIEAPASGRALVIKSLTDAHLGASGTVLVGYRLGSGQTPIFEHALTASNPNWEANLIGREVRGPVRNASGQGDLILIVRPAPVSGLSFTAQVTEMTVSGL